MSYIVTGPVVVIADSVGVKRYYYQGAPLPDDLPSAECERLAEMGLLASTDPPGPAASGGDPAARPPQIAAKSVWVDYAVGHGMDPAEAEALTKGELIERFP